VAFETDIGAMDELGTQQKMLAKMLLPPEDSFEQQVSPRTYSQFTNLATHVGLPPMMYQQFKPAMGAFALMVLEFQKLGLSPENGIDKHFYALARKQGKTIVPFETIDFQLGLLTGFSKAEGEQLVKEVIDEIDTTKSEITDMLNAWQTGDTAALDKLLNRGRQEQPAIFKRLLTDRTRQWVPKVEELLRSGQNAIVIVGAGHLVGDDGLVELLRKKGLKIVQE
jgi:uncharacterized protein YbaP (TraB family)